MSDFIFATEKIESSGKQSENNSKFGKGTIHIEGAKKMAGKRAYAQLARKSKERYLIAN